MHEQKKTSHNAITARIEKSKFTCTRCAACCTGPDAMVMVSPPEIRTLMDATNLSWDEIVAPYPEYLLKQEQYLTFGWTLRHIKDQCIFLEKNHCTVYHVRPWICKTYPFMIDHGQVITSACQGLDSNSDQLIIPKLIQDLTSRTCAEEKEETRVAYWYHIFIQSSPDKGASLIVIDSEGIKPQT